MVILRDLHGIPEYQQVIALELAIWGYRDSRDIVTLPMFIITVKRGAILIGAFDEGERMVGFVYSIVGMKHGRPMQWSHMAGVLAEVRRQGLGRDLKLAQRERAIERGFDLIEWTFDPLQAPNAHLNFAKLGVVSDEYAVNIYGDSTSALHRGTPTDRLVVQWHIREPHVVRRIRSATVLTARAVDAAKAPIVNRDRVDLDIDERRLWVEVPGGFTQMLQQNPEGALEWRLQTREIFLAYFSRGYRAVDFELYRDGGGGRYLLAR